MALVATIKINSSQVAADLTDFPVYVNLADLPASFWNTVANGGGDIRVFKSDGTTELPREVVSCDTSTETGELHFKYSGTLSGSVDTVVQIHADGVSSDYAVTDTYGRNNVWTGYGMVSHNGGITDSTGITTPTNNGVGTTSGKIGIAGDFDGSNDNVLYGDSTDLNVTTGNFSVSAWVKLNTLNTIRHIYEKGYSGAETPNIQVYVGSDNKFRGGYENNGNRIALGTTVATTGVWYHIFVNANRSANTEIFVNGSSEGTTAGTTTTISNTRAVSVGSQRTGISTYQNRMNGQIDEIRFKKDLFSTNWITTEYNNQNSPSTFYTVSQTNISETLSLIEDTFCNKVIIATISETLSLTETISALRTIISTTLENLALKEYFNISKWFNQNKGDSTWSAPAKPSTTFTKESKSSTTWTEQNK